MSGQLKTAVIGRGGLSRLAIGLNGGLALAMALLWVHQAMHDGFWGSDFSCYYSGGAMVRDGHGDQLYDRDMQKQYLTRIVPERGTTGDLLLFVFPPHSAVLAPLFALLPRDPAFYVWTSVQLLLLIPLCYFLRRLTAQADRLQFAAVVAAVLAFPPLFLSFQLGQVSLVLLVCLLGFICNLTAGHPFGTALWLTLGTIKPQMMVVPVAILLAGRRWRELSIAAILLVIWGLAATALLGTSCWLAWVKMIQHTAGQFGQDGVHPLAMYNLKGFLTGVLGGAPAAWINGLTAASLLLAVLVIVAMAKKPLPAGSAEWDLRLALSLQLGLLVNPHMHPGDAVTFVAPAVLFYRGLRRAGQPAHVTAALLVCAPLLFLLDLMIGRSADIRLFFVFMVGLAEAMAIAYGAACGLAISAKPQAAQNCN